MNFGTDPFITLADTKARIKVTSNTFDAQITSMISTSCGLIENYIGQQVKAKNYTDQSFITSPFYRFTTKPVNNIYNVKIGDRVLYDPNNFGENLEGETVEFSESNNVVIDNRKGKFNESSLKIKDGSSNISLSNLPDRMKIEDSSFTVEMWINSVGDTLPTATLFEIREDANNYIALKTNHDSGGGNQVQFDYMIGGSGTTNSGNITNHTAKTWNHVALTRDYENNRVYLHWNGALVQNTSFSIDSIEFSSILNIGNGFVGNIDEVRLSTTKRYSSDSFTPSAYKFITDKYTGLLMHFDNQKIEDVSVSINDYVFDKEFNRLIIVDRYLLDPTKQITIEYNAGYETIPVELQGAAMDYVKVLYKGVEDKLSERTKDDMITRQGSYSNTDSFPVHIQRVLDLYRDLV